MARKPKHSNRTKSSWNLRKTFQTSNDARSCPLFWCFSLVDDATNISVRRQKGVLMGLNLRPNRHEVALKTTATPERLQQLHVQGVILFTRFRLEVETVYYPIGNIAVFGRTPAEAATKLTSLCEYLGLETKESMEEVLGDFMCE